MYTERPNAIEPIANYQKFYVLCIYKDSLTKLLAVRQGEASLGLIVTKIGEESQFPLRTHFKHHVT